MAGLAIPGIVVQGLASLVLVGLVVWLARRLRLGHDARLAGADHARTLARAALCGFEPVAEVLDRAGTGALLRDGQGRVMLLRRHGAQFAARLLDSHADARLDRNFLTIGTSDRQFGTITLDLGEAAQVWAASLRRLEG